MEVITKPKQKKSDILVWKVLFVVGISAFLIYGLSFFFTKPVVETVITPAPPVNTKSAPSPAQYTIHPHTKETPKHKI